MVTSSLSKGSEEKLIPVGTSLLDLGKSYICSCSSNDLDCRQLADPLLIRK